MEEEHVQGYAEIASVLTHAFAFPLLSMLYRRLPCSWLETEIVGFSVMVSLAYHMCSLLEGTSCLYPKAVHQLLDRTCVEAQLLVLLMRMPPFTHNVTRYTCSVLAMIVLIMVKLYADTLWYTGVVCVILILLGLKWVWLNPYFHLAILIGIVGIVFFYLEPVGSDVPFHSLWHIFGYIGLYVLELALDSRKCVLSEDGECRCKVEPLKYWVDTVSGLRIPLLQFYVGKGAMI